MPFCMLRWWNAGGTHCHYSLPMLPSGTSDGRVARKSQYELVRYSSGCVLRFQMLWMLPVKHHQGNGLLAGMHTGKAAQDQSKAPELTNAVQNHHPASA